ncbi:MAG: sulfur carrier protein ThiS adenylyltransferase ThiF [Oscillospiraceae bacterium]|nr:sulfur carrier protein ThiS adenylyltransferase ThiF [Oscillospiraceae bacterium]
MIPTENEVYMALENRHGEAFQKKLLGAWVAVCGLGGLGSNIAICLARAGVGTLHLIDFDRVDLSNIGRQQYFLSQLGMNKTAALSETLEQINPYCRIITDNRYLDRGNIPKLISDSHIICEAFDSPESKAELVDTVIEAFQEKYIVSASGMSGLHTANSITTRKITPKFYLCGDGVSDVSNDRTLYASRVMVCAAHQANAVLKIIMEM